MVIHHALSRRCKFDTPHTQEWTYFQRLLINKLIKEFMRVKAHLNQLVCQQRWSCLCSDISWLWVSCATSCCRLQSELIVLHISEALYLSSTWYVAIPQTECSCFTWHSNVDIILEVISPCPKWPRWQCSFTRDDGVTAELCHILVY